MAPQETGTQIRVYTEPDLTSLTPQETGTQIRVYTEPCPQSTDRVTQISGPKDSVIECLGRILGLLDEVRTGR